MPGIVGIVNSQGFDIAGEHVQSMLQPMARHDWQTRQILESRRAVFGSVQIDTDARMVQQGGMMLAWAGEIVQQEELRGSLRVPPLAGLPFAAVLLRLAQEKGPRALCGLNGIYVIAVWDENAGRLHLINDRYGLQKMYLHSGNGSFVFSSEMKVFAGPERRISAFGAAQLLSLGYLLDEETLYHDVSLLPPAALLTVEQGRVTVERYWNHNFNGGGETPLPVSDYLGGMAERAQVAVARRVRPDSAILLTGGLDSRLLSGMWDRAAPGASPDALTLGQPEASDVIIAREVALALGFPFHHIPLTPAYLVDLSEQCVWVTEGNMNVHASWILAANRLYRQLGTRFALTGVGGEAAAGRHILLEAMPPTWEAGVDAFLRSHRLPYIGSFLRKEIASDLMRQVEAAVRRTVREAPADHHLNKLDYYSYHQSLRRHATSIDVFADYAHPLDPLLDNDLIDYVQAIPPELRARGYLYKRMIRRSLPHIAPIGKNLRGPILKPSLEKSLASVTNLSRRAGRRIRRIASHNSFADNPQGYIYPNAWLRGGSKAFALAVFDQADRLADLLDLDAVCKLVDAHMSGERNDYSTVCGLMTLILWKKIFVDGDTAPVDSREANFALPTETAV